MSTPHKKTTRSSSSRTPNDILQHSTTGRAGISKDRSIVKATKLKNIFVNGKEQEQLMAACSSGDVNKVEQLLLHTTPPLNPDQIRDDKLRSPLLIACASGKADLVRLLVKHGADVNNPVGDIIGNRPLDLAVVSNNVDTVLALLELGAMVQRPVKPSTGRPVPTHQRINRTPLDLAQARLDMMARYDRPQNDDFMAQVVQIVKLLRYFTVEPSAGPAQELDELTARLSSIGIQEREQEKDLIKDLGSVISRLKLE